MKNVSKRVLVYTAVQPVFRRDAFYCSLPCDRLGFREISSIRFFNKPDVITMKIIYLQLEIYLVDLKEEKNVRLIPRRQEADVCVFRNSPHYFCSTVVLRTYILWAPAGIPGVTVVNLRCRNTKQTQMMRVTQQQHSTADAVNLQQ